MTAAKAWSTALEQLRVNMPEAAHDKWVSHTVLLSAKDAAFVIAAPDRFARDWLESRLSSTITRLLTGICNRPTVVRFVELRKDMLVGRGLIRLLGQTGDLHRSSGPHRYGPPHPSICLSTWISKSVTPPTPAFVRPVPFLASLPDY